MQTESVSRTDQPTVVSASERQVPPAQQTGGIRREQAFAGEDRWVGYVTSDPGEWSGWHHHGQTDTYFYVLRGAMEFEFGDRGDTIAVNAGDFCHVPKGVIHRERPRPGERAELVLVRIGTGPTVVNVDGPSPDR
jgi:mannose-6-phosphate isomerase-like protein (cupin superfamily)